MKFKLLLVLASLFIAPILAMQHNKVEMRILYYKADKRVRSFNASLDLPLGCEKADIALQPDFHKNILSHELQLNLEGLLLLYKLNEQMPKHILNAFAQIDKKVRDEVLTLYAIEKEHSVESAESAFRIAAAMAFKAANE